MSFRRKNKQSIDRYFEQIVPNKSTFHHMDRAGIIDFTDAKKGEGTYFEMRESVIEMK